MVLRQPIVQRREHGSDRSRVDAAVGVSAHVAINRTGIQAGTATDTKQALAQRSAKDLRAAVVHDDQVKLVRPVQFARLPGARDQRRVNRQLLTRRRTSQHLEQVRQVLQSRDHLLHPHDGDVDSRQRRRQSRVAFVRDQGDRPRFGDGEVDARDAHVGLGKTRAQLPPRERGQLFPVVGERLIGDFVENVRHVVLRQMQRGSHDMGRPMPGDLDDVLAKNPSRPFRSRRLRAPCSGGSLRWSSTSTSQPCAPSAIRGCPG